MEVASQKDIENKIFVFRGNQVMIDHDLADLYDVKTKALNQAVKRNLDRFPEPFMFQLNDSEKNELVTICDRFKSLKHSSSNPFAFTEQGVAMLSAILRSDVAIKVSVQIINAFVEMRKFIYSNSGLLQRLDRFELKLSEHDQQINKVLNALEQDNLKPSKGIFFDGQVFDAYVFVSNLIRTARSDIILIDNYIDESVLKILSKRRKGVKATIYTKNRSERLELDLEKYNEQYENILLTTLRDSHDRFLIIDKNELYHIGASLKDLGKKWFAFSKMDSMLSKILDKLD